jgi:urease accessory protein
MISAESIIGNIKDDAKLNDEYKTMCKNDICEKIRMSRMESQRVRMRKRTDKGTDVGIRLAPGTIIRNGDVILLEKDKMIVVEIEPERVAVIQVKDHPADHDFFELTVKIGHALGNLHRPIGIDGYKIYLPIQDDSEIDMLNTLFASISDHVQITKEMQVFEPHVGMEGHEHG